VRKRDPRRLLRGYQEARARVRIVEVPEMEAPPGGSVFTMQSAEVTLPRSELDRIWSAEYLERLARTYWRFLTRVSLGVLRVLYTESSREVVLLTRPFVLLRFHAPEYDIEPDRGSVMWPIDRGLLVAPAGRGRGYLRLTVRRPREQSVDSEDVTVTVDSEVASFYPTIRGWGWASRMGQWLYRVTQLEIHVIVTHAFLRSLARLDLAPSVVGALLPEQSRQSAVGSRQGEGSRASRSARR
jgi:hypothetical protein